MTLKEVKAGGIPNQMPVYRTNPYMLVDIHGNIVTGGTLEFLKQLGEVWDESHVWVRNVCVLGWDNTKLPAPTAVSRATGLWLGGKHIASWSNGSTPEIKELLVRLLNESLSPKPAVSPTPPVGDDYAYPSIKDYEELVGFKVNTAFESGWMMARTKNSHLGIMSKSKD